MKAALIILVHDSVPCTVITGKVNTISETESVVVRHQLLLHTQHITMPLPADKFLFLNEDGKDNSIWTNTGYIKRMRRGRSAGEIMMHAFSTIFSLGYSEVVAIGSDSIETEINHLEQAFDYLSNYDVVIGPAQEGGFYLLGMKKMQPSLFKQKAWNTPVLLEQMLIDIAKLNLNYHLLQVLSDVDEEKDKYLFLHRQ
jgi:rSAM/selenodomain-associated transferase 1